MDKSESKEQGDANKRPSARRAASESDPPTESTGKAPKRVRARRPSQQPAEEGIELAGDELDVPVSPSEGIGFSTGDMGSQETPAGPIGSPPAPRARARRPRASQQLGDQQTNRQTKPRAASASATETQSQPTAAALEDEERTSLHSDVSELVPASAAADALEASSSWSTHLRRVRDDEDDFAPPSLEHADFADDFGLDPQYESKLRPWLDSLCERHFHVELHGAENIPAHGRAMLVANHSRASVWDGIVLRAALRAHHPASRVPRWLIDDQQFHAPFLGTFVNRLGAVRACQENAERLLLREELVAVFPEGSKATERPYEERYRLQRFGRGGYVKLALRTGTPVFPVAIVATEFEGAVWRNRLANASRMLTAPFAVLRPLGFGLGPGMPRMGTLGMPPISARIRIYVGAAVAEISRQDASATRDDGLVHELNECVRSAVQNLVNSGLHA